MAYKEFILDNNKSVKIYKRRNSRNLKLSIDNNGQIKVSIPKWAPYKAGIEFAKSRVNWIDKQQIVNHVLINNQAIGKAHHLIFKPKNINSVTSRITDNEIIISYPENIKPNEVEIQSLATKASVKALRRQSEKLLPQRLKYLADKNNCDFNSVKVKQLKRRWGSCDQHQNIVLNLYLIQLPWNLIDYVLLHELAHTKVLKHDKKFWDTLESFLPGAKNIKKDLNKFHPVIIGTNFSPM